MPIETITNHVNQINYNTLTNIDNDNHNTSHKFSNYIDNLLNSINLTQNNAKKNSQEFILEKPGVSLSDIMIDLQKSSISINMAVQIRNKVISAYQEIMNMQV
ncbi:flagellar hook-basal body complex protein FliE [Buchnera aphidicola (Formosaphis micheliae)]|uniref:flagellar hook-basal body complex protein FliE n=1 Tax=Buchnera aphidicola TaxID=9 RepID=UPI0031CC5609